MDQGARAHFAIILNLIRDDMEMASRDNSVGSIEPLEQFVRQADDDFPGVLPNLDRNAMRGRWPVAFGRYDMPLLRTWFGMALSCLQAAHAPVSQELLTPAALTFVTDTKLREILELDLSELRKAYAGACLKSTIVLCGAAIEALLVDALLRDSATRANAPSHAQLLEWGLAKLIEKAVEYNLIQAAAAKFSHSVREYRNLVHPGRVIRESLAINVEEARIAIDILNIICRDLTTLSLNSGEP